VIVQISYKTTLKAKLLTMLDEICKTYLKCIAMPPPKRQEHFREAENKSERVHAGK
jgi:hypothetical protein